MIAQVFGSTIGILAQRKRAVLGAIFLPSVLLIATEILVAWMPVSYFLFAFLPLIAYSWLAVSVHRAVLLEEHSGTAWGWRVGRFTVYLLFVSISIGLAIWVITGGLESIGFSSSGIVAVAFEILLWATILYWSSQYFLIFPAIAVDHKYSFTHSSVDAEDYRIAVFVVIAIFPILLSLIELPAKFISAPIPFLLVSSMLWIISITFGVAMVSMLYKNLVANGTYSRKRVSK